LRSGAAQPSSFPASLCSGQWQCSLGLQGPAGKGPACPSVQRLTNARIPFTFAVRCPFAKPCAPAPKPRYGDFASTEDCASRPSQHHLPHAAPSSRPHIAEETAGFRALRWQGHTFLQPDHHRAEGSRPWREIGEKAACRVLLSEHTARDGRVQEPMQPRVCSPSEPGSDWAGRR
jgi:hypothetical protein